MKKELPIKQLRKICLPKEISCRTTKDMKVSSTIIGQERAVKALEFGLRITNTGFNIYVSGMPGTGRETAVKHFLEVEAKGKPVPDDLCYVYNFRNSYRPKALTLPAGWGMKLKRDMTALEEDAHREIGASFESEEYANEKNMLAKTFQRKKEEMFREVTQKAKEDGFLIQSGPMGLLTTPLKDGEPMKEEEFQALEEKEQKVISLKREGLQDGLKAVIRQAKALDKEMLAALQEMDKKVGLFAIEHSMEEMREKYKKFPVVRKYLDLVTEDMLNNLAHFKDGGGEAAEGQKKPKTAPMRGKDRTLRKYEVNVLVDNSELKGAPVIIASNPSYTHLFGRIEKEAQFGALVTDFTMIREGDIHQANGGYLVIPVEELFRNALSWDSLKRALRTGNIAIEEPGERMGMISTKSLQPEPIPLNLKVILIGTSSIYHVLYSHDEDFSELFKVKADFDTSMERSRKNIKDYTIFVSSMCESEGLNHLDSSALTGLVELGSRLADDQRRLSTRFGVLTDAIREANHYARQEKAKLITREHIHKAVEENFYRSSLYNEKLKKYMADGTIKVSVTGEETGQINGLSVLSLGDVSFGQPSRITVSTGIGREGIIDIERQANLGGPSHTKGVMILSGFLNQRYARDRPLSLTARLVFEQSYNGVDGDSASSTELYAILSNLSGVPIKQSIAVTGSVNQKGEVQAIGGINHKIEGFFEVCKMKGLTGEQGVMMPQSNILNLMLKEEVLEAVKAKKFHIWAISSIDEGIELLTGVKAGKKNKSGNYPKNSINYLVDKRLQEMAETLKEFRAI